MKFNRKIHIGEMTRLPASIITLPAVTVNIRNGNLLNFYNQSSCDPIQSAKTAQAFEQPSI